MVALSLTIVAVVAWLIGLGSYVLALNIAWEQSMSSLSLLGVVGETAVVWAFAYPCLYLPVLVRVGTPLPVPLRFCVLPLVALLLGFATVVLLWLSMAVHTLLFGYGWSSFSLRFFTSPEAGLFYWFFGAASVVVGLAFASARPQTI